MVSKVNNLRQRLVVGVVLVIALYFLTSATPKIFGEDVKQALQDRLSTLEKDYSEKKDQVRSLEKIIEIKESQSKDLKKAEAQQKEILDQKESELSKLHAKLQELEDAHKLELEKAKSEVTAIEKTNEDSSITKINKRLSKKYYSKETPKYQRVTYTASDADPDSNELIIMASIGHSESYGKGRSFKDFLDVVSGMDYDKKTATLGLLVGSTDEFANIQSVIEEAEQEDFFSKVIIVQSEFIESLHTVDREMRHKLSFQKERRRAISRARNFLLTNTLQDESYTLCLDSDMIELPKDMLNIFLNSELDIVVPRIRQGGAENYDFNSWKGDRVQPSPEEDLRLDSNDPEFVFVPRPDGAAHMHDLYNNPDYGNYDKEDIKFAVEIDSVGGAVLFVKSEIFKQGVVFPPYYIIGTKWPRFEGYDGIETEGVCYQARTIGYKCWGMPNLVAWHTEEIEKLD